MYGHIISFWGGRGELKIWLQSTEPAAFSRAAAYGSNNVIQHDTLCTLPFRSTYTCFCLCKCITLTLSPSFSPPAEPLSLMDLCRRSVRVALGRERLSEIHRLPLPASLKNYLLYQWRRRQSQHSEHTLISLCFSGIILGLNLFDSIAQASRTESASWFYEYASMSVAGLLFSFLSCF